MSILFHNIVFGPVRSRRLGFSLGINLLPVNSKICSFNCIYCECGWTPENLPLSGFNSRNNVFQFIESRLKEIKTFNEPLDVITFAGNGEPTLHPQFSEILKDVILLRNKYVPEKKIAVLSNATTLGNPKIVEALKKIDLPILKLDSAIESTFRIMNNPPATFNFKNYILNLSNFKNRIILQTMFLRREINGQKFDNTTDSELKAWLTVVKNLNPKNVMIYTIDREPPSKNLIKISPDELNKIAQKIKLNNIPVQTSY